MNLLAKARSSMRRTIGNEDGVVGYGIAWLMGVPVTVLVVLYLIFG